MFHYGSTGEGNDKFYVILNGKVSVNIPNPLINHWKEKQQHF